jgi:hypothetical protein
MIGTERLHTRINDVPAGWSSIFITFLPCNTDNDHSDLDSSGLCVTFGRAVDLKLRKLKLTAQLTSELGNRHMFATSNGMSGGMVIWGELRAWHGLASVFCFLFVFCLYLQWLSV